ncbi:MAG: acyltransferase [Rudaea sp.]
MIAANSAGANEPGDGYTAYRQRRHFGSLDGLRALSVIAVVWHHTVGHDPSLPALFGTGAQGVTLFFAISGFLIVTLLLREQEERGSIDLRAFYMRRALRIFPLYFTVLALYLALVLGLERHTSAGREFLINLPFFLTYTSNWFVLLEGRVIFYFAWSLATEEQFYLVWPWVQRYVSPKRALAVMLAIALAVALVQQYGAGEAATDGNLGRRMIESISLAICFGVVLAHLLHRQRSYEALQWLFRWRGSSAVWAIAVLGLLQWQAPGFVVQLAMALLVGACVYREDHALAPLLRWRALAAVGATSYGVYLLHMLVKNVVLKALAPLGLQGNSCLVFVVTLTATIAVARMSFRYFESYFLRRKSRYERSMRASRSSVALP